VIETQKLGVWGCKLERIGISRVFRKGSYSLSTIKVSNAIVMVVKILKSWQLEHAVNRSEARVRDGFIP